jgi:hypothetical protein
MKTESLSKIKTKEAGMHTGPCVHGVVKRRRSMDINAKPGTIIILNDPSVGYPHDQKTLKDNGLTVGGKYTVDHTEPDNFQTYVYLREYPGVAFNTMNFCDAT